MAIVSDARTFSSADLFNPANVYDLSSSSRPDIRKLALALRFAIATTATGLAASESVEQLVRYGYSTSYNLMTTGCADTSAPYVYTVFREGKEGVVPESQWLPAVQDLYNATMEVEGLHSRAVSYRTPADDDTMAQLVSLLDFVHGYGDEGNRHDVTPLIGRYSMYGFLDVKSYAAIALDGAAYDTVIDVTTAQAMIDAVRNQPTTEESEPVTLARHLRVDLTGASEYQRRAVAEWMASDRSVNGRYDSRNRVKVSRMDTNAVVYCIDFDGELFASDRLSGNEVNWQDVWSQVGQAHTPKFTAWHVHLDTSITVEQLTKLVECLNNDASPDCPAMEVGDLLTRISNGLDAVGVDSEGAIVLASVGKCLPL